jgi:hypothetical protein
LGCKRVCTRVIGFCLRLLELGSRRNTSCPWLGNALCSKRRGGAPHVHMSSFLRAVVEKTRNARPWTGPPKAFCTKFATRCNLCSCVRTSQVALLAFCHGVPAAHEAAQLLFHRIPTFRCMPCSSPIREKPLLHSTRQTYDLSFHTIRFQNVEHTWWLEGAAGARSRRRRGGGQRAV